MHLLLMAKVYKYLIFMPVTISTTQLTKALFFICLIQESYFNFQLNIQLIQTSIIIFFNNPKRMDPLLTTLSLQNRIKQYSQLTYLEFCVLPELLFDYIYCLLQLSLKQRIPPIFQMMIETFLQFNPSFLEADNYNTNFGNNISNALYSNITKIALNGQIDETFYSKYIPLKFYRVVINDLLAMSETQDHRVYLQSLYCYFQVQAFFEQVRMGQSSKNLSLFRSNKIHLVQTYIMALEQLPSTYAKFKQIFMSTHQKLAFVLQIPYQKQTMNNQTQNILKKQMQQQFLPQQMAISQFQYLCQNQSQQQTMLKKAIEKQINFLSKPHINRTIILCHIFLKQYPQYQRKVNIFCILAGLNFLNRIFEHQDTIVSLKNAVQLHHQISDFDKPDLQYVGYFACMISYHTNILTQQQLNTRNDMLYDLFSAILTCYDNQKISQHYMKIVLITLMQEIITSKSKSKQKVHQLWKKINENLQFINCLNQIVSLSLLYNFWMNSRWQREKFNVFGIFEQPENVEQNFYIFMGISTFEFTIPLFDNDLINRIMDRQLILLESFSILKKQKHFIEVVATQIGKYLFQQKYEDCFIVCLTCLKSLLQNNLQTLINDKLNMVLVILSICLSKMNLKIQSIIVVSLSSYPINYTQLEKQQHKSKTIRHIDRWISCIASYQLMQYLVYNNQQFLPFFDKWIDKQENYQWLSQGKRKRILLKKISKMIDLLSIY